MINIQECYAINDEIFYEGARVMVTTDETDFDRFYSGYITFISLDCIQLDGCQLIKWEYILTIDHV